jgi:hypothetical protein
LGCFSTMRTVLRFSLAIFLKHAKFDASNNHAL